MGHIKCYSTQILGSKVHRSEGHLGCLVPNYKTATLHFYACLQAMRLAIPVSDDGKSYQTQEKHLANTEWKKWPWGYRDDFFWRCWVRVVSIHDDWLTGTKAAQLIPPRKASLWISIMGGQSIKAKEMRSQDGFGQRSPIKYGLIYHCWAVLEKAFCTNVLLLVFD